MPFFQILSFGRMSAQAASRSQALLGLIDLILPFLHLKFMVDNIVLTVVVECNH